MLQHEQRNVRFYPKGFSSVENAPQVKSKYHRVDSDGQVYLDLNKIQQDLDPIAECDCKNCPKGNCKNRKAVYDPALHAGGIDPVSAVASAVADVAKSTKKGDAAALARQQLLMLKAQCVKPPLIRISKAARQKKVDYDNCIAAAAKAQKDFEIQMAQIGLSTAQASANANAAAKTAAPAAAATSNKTLYWAIGIGAFVLILVVVIIIIAMRMMKKQTPAKKGG